LPQQTKTDFLVIGAGIAGLRAAIEAAAAGRVLVLAKSDLNESATQYAQGGIAVALSDEDEVGLHLQDTLVAGDGLCNEEAARILVGEGPERIQELIDWGTAFDRSGAKLAFTREGAHSRSRVLHAHGDSTGREIGRSLYARAASLPNITLSAHEFTTELVIHRGRVAGAVLLSGVGALRVQPASAVLLASGGLGQVYRETTNPAVATGDGVAMAWRTGAEISDLEMVQFHPTALYLPGAPRFLLSEALRGEGAYLRNAAGERFMPQYHPLAELAPRDVVSRAIVSELGPSNAAENTVYLDLTHLDAEHVRQRFPRIHSTCLEYGVDIATKLIPVRPAAHYAMGGVRTDLEGRTSIPGLYAAGEVACTGVHGANRLASNSLLEGLVFGARAGGAMRAEFGAATSTAPPQPAGPAVRPERRDLARVTAAMRDLMWRNVAIIRERDLLREAIAELERLGAQLPNAATIRAAAEARNLQQVALLIARSALAREESRGAHFRSDFPMHNDQFFRKHSLVRGDTLTFE
jgi:L-aspartate oxidase